MSNKDTLIIQCYIDKRWLWFIRLISNTLFVAPVLKIEEIENFIDNEKYKEAENLLDKIEKEYDQSVFTIRLRTHISVIQILGE